MAENSVSRPDRNLQISVGVDCSEAISGFKALQRAIKDATKEIKELESAFVTLPVDGIDIKGAEAKRENVYNNSFRREGRYLIIEFGNHEPTGELISFSLKGNEPVMCVYQTNKIGLPSSTLSDKM